jgi:ATPase subunit of ABC transporter with duplicated ATPase domains
LATHIWRVAGDDLSAYKGNYEEYLRQRAAEGEVKVEAKAEVEAPEYDRERAREERRQRKAAERLAEQAMAMEQEIHALEAKLSTLGVQLEAASLAGDVGRIHSLGLTYEATEAELHRVMHEWAELA